MKPLQAHRIKKNFRGWLPAYEKYRPLWKIVCWNCLQWLEIFFTFVGVGGASFHYKFFPLQIVFLKELRNCILCIIRVCSVLCSVRVSISLHFLSFFGKSRFLCFVFLYLWLLVFSFVFCFEFNILKGFIKTTESPTTDPPTIYHLATDPPTHRPFTHRPTDWLKSK